MTHVSDKELRKMAIHTAIECPVCYAPLHVLGLGVTQEQATALAMALLEKQLKLVPIEEGEELQRGHEIHPDFVDAFREAKN